MMDVESLAKQLILQNMTPEQQMAVLDGIKASIAQAKEVQKRKIGENVDLVVQALKKIEADIRERYDAVGNAIEKRVASIKDGRDGIDGRNGRDGKDGKPGKDGAVGRPGRDGKDGKDGRDGIDGISVISANIDFDGSLIIKLSNGKEINVGEVVPMDLAERIKIIGNGGGTSQTVLDTLDSLQTQINNLIPSQTGNSGKYLTTNGTTLSWASIAGGGLSYQGTWNASTNTPTLASGTGTNGYYYVVGTSGSTNLDGISDWVAGDWALFNGTIWQKIDQTNLVSSVNGQTGAVSLTTSNISEGSNLYYTDARARSALSAGTGISYNSSTGTITNSAPDQTVALTGSGTVSISGTYPNFTITGADQYQGTVTSVAMTVPTGLSVSGTPITSTGTLAVTFASGYSIPTNTSQTNWDTAYTDRLKWDGGSTGLDAATGRTSLGLGTIATQAASNVSITGGSITGITDLAIADGGTGLSSYTAGDIVYYSSGTAFSKLNIGTANTVLTSSGSAPQWSTSLTLSGNVTAAAFVPSGSSIPTNGMYLPATNSVGIATNSTQRVQIDSSGNVGIGTTSTLGNSLLNVSQGVVARNSGTTLPYFQTYNSNAGTDLKTWRIGGNSSGGLVFETVNDAYSSSTSRAIIDSSGNFQFNSGYGSVATAYGCRAWVNFNGIGTVTIRASGNVSSITDNGTGDYTVNFTTAMPDANYAVAGSAGNGDTGSLRVISTAQAATPTTTTTRLLIHNLSASATDPTYVSVAIFR